MAESRCVTTSICLCVGVFIGTCAYGESISGARMHDNAIAINITSVDIRPGHISVHYTLMNKGDIDVWVCSAMNVRNSGFEIVGVDSGRTLLLRKRVGIPWGIATNPIMSRYIHLAKGKSLTESLILPSTTTLQVPPVTLGYFFQGDADGV